MFRPIWLRLFSRRLFIRRLAGASPRRHRRAARHVKPRLESLEIRVVPTTFEVVGNVTGPGQFLSLSAALGAASSGDTIQIEAGSHPGSGTVNQNNLTIQGDPAVGAAGLQASNSRIDGLLISGDNDTVTNVFADDIFIGQSATNPHISNNIYSPGGGVFNFNGNFNAVATTADRATVTFSAGSQTVQLTAKVQDVSNPSTVINEGTVTFTVEDADGNMVGNAVTSSTVHNGVATAVYTVPAGQAVGVYTIAPRYVDTGGALMDFQDNNATLTIQSASANGDNVTATAAAASATFSSADQTVQLSATVKDTTNSSTIVNEGTVTFTVKDSSGNTIGNSVSGPVQNGAATANFTLPGGTASGVYTIGVSYSDSAGNFTDTQDVDANLTVGNVSKADDVTTTARPATVAFSSADQTVHLSAAVTDTTHSSTIVNEGTVTFTILDSNGHVVGKAVTGSVQNGVATADFTLPGGTPVGTYTIGVSYTDPAGNFNPTQVVSAALTVSNSVNPGHDNVTTSANSTTVKSSTSSQPVQLTANVLDTSNSNTLVNEGTVTFTVKDSGGNTIGVPATSLTVANGVATATYTLPAGQAAGTYTIFVHYTDSAGNFTDTQDNSGTLTVRSASAPDDVSVAANPVTVTFNAASQPVQLTAKVTDTTTSSTVVNEGTVTFTVKDASGNLIGVPATSLTVQNGVAVAAYTLPAGQAVGPYFITVHYTDSANKFTDTQDSGSTLTVQAVIPDNVTTTAKAASAFFSPVDRTVKLSADLKDTTNTGTTVNEGTVTFTVVDANGDPIGNAVTGTVSGGTASADFTIPGGTASSAYGIKVSYTDAKGAFADKTDVPAQLSLNPAKIDTSVDGGAALIFNPNDQTIAVSGTLSNASHADDPITEGTASFGVLDGNGNVVGSLVDVSFDNTKKGPLHVSTTLTVPGGAAGGIYGIVLGYKDPSGNYTWNSFKGAPLSIGSATSSVQLTAAAVTPQTGTAFQIETLTAQASDPFGAITEGKILFTVANQTYVASVDGNGNASITVALPLLTAAGPQTIQVDYVDNTADFTASRRIQTIQWNSSDALPLGASANVAFGADGSQVVQTLSFGSTLFTEVFDAFGRLAVIDFGFLNLSFNYNSFGELSQVSFDGVPVLFFLYSAQGQFMGAI
jgi:hypothetical protein